MSPTDGSVDDIIDRARDLPGGSVDDDTVCAFVTICTMNPNAPGTSALLDEFVEGETAIFLMLSSVCPGLLDEAGVSAIG